MTEHHPITPPPELVEKWICESDPNEDMCVEVATRAAQWGADQELEACCEWLEDVDCEDPQETAKHLRAARRRPPSSLKEQALEELNLTADPNGAELSRTQVELIRRALEQLDD